MASPAFEPEFAGAAANVAAQRAVLALHDVVRDHPGLVSRGNRVAHLTAGNDNPETLTGLLRRFGAAICFLDPRQVAPYRAAFEAAGFATARFEIFRPGRGAARRWAAIVGADRPGRLGLRLTRIGPETPAETVRRLQALLAEAGLPELPGYFLRGRLEPTLSLALLDPAERVVGCALAMDEGGAGAGFAGWYFASSVAVAPAWRGQGLGRWLNAAALHYARRERGAVHLRQGVAPGNRVSRRMIAGCGLEAQAAPVGVLAARELGFAAWRE